MVLQAIINWSFKAIRTKKNNNTWVVSIPAPVAKQWNLSTQKRSLLVSLTADSYLLIKPDDISSIPEIKPYILKEDYKT